MTHLGYIGIGIGILAIISEVIFYITYVKNMEYFVYVFFGHIFYVFGFVTYGMATKSWILLEQEMKK